MEYSQYDMHVYRYYDDDDNNIRMRFVHKSTQTIRYFIPDGIQLLLPMFHVGESALRHSECASRFP